MWPAREFRVLRLDAQGPAAKGVGTADVPTARLDVAGPMLQDQERKTCLICERAMSSTRRQLSSRGDEAELRVWQRERDWRQRARDKRAWPCRLTRSEDPRPATHAGCCCRSTSNRTPNARPSPLDYVYSEAALRLSSLHTTIGHFHCCLHLSRHVQLEYPRRRASAHLAPPRQLASGRHLTKR